MVGSMNLRFGFSLQGRGRLADRDSITALAQRADALGYDSIWVTDRLLIPVESRTPYPYSPTGAFPLGPDEPWLEALTAVTYLATVTTRIAVGTSVLVIPYRNPVVTAKALATADYLSGGRIILGAGAGWWREEFAGLGVPFEDRGARTLEYLRLMRTVWTEPRIAFQGRFAQIDPAGGVRPHPASRPHIPIWIGGESQAAMRRVVAVGDGWHPIGLRPPSALHPPELARRVRRLREMAEQAGRDPDAITISFKAPLGLDGTATATAPRTLLSGSAAEIAADLRAYAEAGVRHFVFDFTVATVPEMQSVLERFAAEVRPRLARGGAL
jgi:probable F420-dependent oxidoreductase